MAVAMRERWTDERIDDLKASMEGSFRRVDERFDKVDERFDKVDERFDRLDEKLDRRFDAFERRFEQVDQRFDSLMISMMHGWIVFAAAMVSGFVALAVAAL